jgi:RNA polymerase sigma factor (sigma-70 family)
MSTAPTDKENINLRANELIRALNYKEIDENKFLDSITDLLYAPLLVRIRHQLWTLGCKDMEPDEVFHEAMIRFLEHRPDLNITLFPWFCSVTKNLIIDHVRKHGRQTTGFDEHADGHGNNLHPGPTWQWLAESAVKDALGSIPDNWSFALDMHYFYGYTQEELATLLDVERSLVDYYIRSARDLLKKNKKLIGLISKKKQSQKE